MTINANTFVILTVAADAKMDVLGTGTAEVSPKTMAECGQWGVGAEGDGASRLAGPLKRRRRRRRSLSDHRHFRAGGKGTGGALFCSGKSSSCFYSYLCHKQQQNLIPCKYSEPMQRWNDFLVKMCFHIDR